MSTDNSITEAKKQLSYISEQMIRLSATEDKYVNYEMEAKFGTKGIRAISKIDYDNVIKKIKSSGFSEVNKQGEYILKIQSEYFDPETRELKTARNMDAFRVDIVGIHGVQQYCRTNSLEGIQNVEIMRKQFVRVSGNDGKEVDVKAAEFSDFNFRVSLKKEITISKTSKMARSLLQNWNSAKKKFRYMNRTSYIHPSSPMRIDMSITKATYTSTTNIGESNVFNRAPTYEIEIELVPDSTLTADEITVGMQKITKLILSGLQRTNYPISYTEQTNVLHEYLKVVYPDEIPGKFVPPFKFIGPSSKALQLENIVLGLETPPTTNITVPGNYCVTEKADGMRHLLFISKTGKIYLIGNNLNVIFTGAKTETSSLYQSILDGELMLHDKNNVFINTFSAFDLYFMSGNDVRKYPFMKVASKSDEKELYEHGTRLAKLQKLIGDLNPTNIATPVDTAPVPQMSSRISKLLKKKPVQVQSLRTPSPIIINAKKFYPDYSVKGGSTSIFKACASILNTSFPYETDGLIITHTTFGVGGSSNLVAGPLRKITWDYSFKWKPSEFNTIDFLVTTKKNPDGSDLITPIFQPGVDNYAVTQFQQYKTLILRVGYNPQKDGYLNPCEDILQDKYGKSGEKSDEYKPVQFFPTEPSDKDAGLCNVMLELDGTDTYRMFSEEREVFEDNTIVEFKYEMSKKGLWRWTPLRVRYDKTAEYKQGNKQYGNSYATANSNWYSIHHPITKEMISGENVPTEIDVNPDIYYRNRTTSRQVGSGLRSFHNVFIKNTLIEVVSKKGDILIDFACGKAGDLPKWDAAKLSFVFGIDISKDNLENKINGACARYMQTRNKNPDTPINTYVLFANGNSSLNIRNGAAMLDDKSLNITKAVFGSITKSPTMAPAIQRQYGKGDNGFDVSSCQFAIHYMFESNTTFYNFIQNVAECTKLNGYFIGTCYDGRTIFNMLKGKSSGDKITLDNNGQKMWEIVKMYPDETVFSDNESSLGHKIMVYQESIGNSIGEYLVNFDFLVRTMENYGLVIATVDNAAKLGLPPGNNMMFDALYNTMRKNSKYSNIKLDDWEKKISFLNRAFIFKKVRTVDAANITKQHLDKLPDEVIYEADGTDMARDAIKEAETAVESAPKKKIIIKVKKTKKKVMLGDV